MAPCPCPPCVQLVKLWDLRSCAVVSEAAVHTGPVAKLAFSPARNQLMSAALDGTVATWDV